MATASGNALSLGKFTTLNEATDDMLDFVRFHVTFLPSDHTYATEPQCSRCTLRHGTYIEPGFKPGARTLKNSTLLDSVESVCPPSYQCVGNDGIETHGCCEKCNNKQVCPGATINLGGSDSVLWNLCPPGFLCNSEINPTTSVKSCEAGTMCMDNRQMSCKEARQIPIDAGFGDIHAGTYCPPLSFGLVICPQGFYCNSTDMTEALPCPAGMFCPYKTENPEIACAGCVDQATERGRNPGIIIFLIILAVLIILGFAVGKLIQKKRESKVKNKKKVDASVQIAIDTKRMTASVMPQMMPGSMMTGSMTTGSANGDSLKLTAQAATAQALPMSNSRRASFMISHVKDLVKTISSKESFDIQPSTRGLVSKISLISEDGDGDSTVPVLSTNGSSSNVLGSNFDAEVMFDKLDVNGDGDLSFEELNEILNLSDVKLRYFVRRINKLDGAPLDATTITKRCFVNYFADVLMSTESFEPDEDEAAEIFEAIDLDGSGTIDRDELHSSILENIFSDRQIRTIIKKMAPDGQDIDKETFVKMYPLLLTELDDVTVKERSIDISFSNLKLTVNSGASTKVIVDSVSGRIQERTMTAIMGGSGCGKTSMLNTLCGRAFYGNVTGTVKINGQVERIENHKHLLGFVPQDDIVYAELTVRENLIYAGRFQLPPETTTEEIKEFADDVIASLGLTRVREARVGDVRRRGVSGGEKKRVNIGLELMGKPRILFLDEPTSGLDASSSSLVMASLKSLVSNEGVTCVSVIHQPRKFIFELFDNVMLLGAGGRLVYHGNPLYSQTYFENLNYTLPPGENISDWLLDISTGQMGIPDKDEGDCQNTRLYLFNKWDDFVNNTPDDELEYSLIAPESFEIPGENGKPSFFSQVYFHVKRNLLVSYRNMGSVIAEGCVVILAVIFISVVNGKLVVVHPVAIQNLRDNLGGFIAYPKVFVESIESFNSVDILKVFFQPFTAAANFIHRTGGMKLSIITCVLVGLAGTRHLSAKKLEFYRESSSGYNINAYYFAVNVTSTVEMIIQMIIAGFFAAFISMPISSWVNFILNFVVLGFGCLSWSLLLSIVIDEKNLVMVTGFLLAVTNIFLGGGLPPIEFPFIYSRPFVKLLAGLLAPGRYFLETFVASDYKCLPTQYGFTFGDDATSFPAGAESFNVTGIGESDENIALQNCGGWYGAYLPAIFVGIFLRVLAGGMIHVVDRNKQSKTELRLSLKDKSFLMGSIIYLTCILCSFGLAVFLVMR